MLSQLSICENIVYACGYKYLKIKDEVGYSTLCIYANNWAYFAYEVESNKLVVGL